MKVHPSGLRTLFFTEMWERFSYYGMRALLVLFMTAAVAEGGLGMDDVTATAIYGLYSAAVYLAALWVNLGRRNLDPSIPVKFALGLIQLGLGFFVMFFAAGLVAAGESVLPTWLFFTYLLHTTGELCLSPVGLSAISKLSPKRYLSQMMGIWFLGAALGNLIAGLLAGRFDPESLNDMPGLYLQIVLVTIGAGLLLLAAVKPMRKFIGDQTRA